MTRCPTDCNRTVWKGEPRQPGELVRDDVPVYGVLEELRLDDAERVDRERQGERGHDQAAVRLQVTHQPPDAAALELPDRLFLVELLNRCRHASKKSTDRAPRPAELRGP
jgi:hypothetical protein